MAYGWGPSSAPLCGALISHVFGMLEVTMKAEPVGPKGFKYTALLEVPTQTHGIWSLAAAWVQAEQGTAPPRGCRGPRAVRTRPR